MPGSRIDGFFQATVVPQNKVSAAEKGGDPVGAELTQFVDLAPMQVYTKLLDQEI